MIGLIEMIKTYTDKPKIKVQIKQGNYIESRGKENLPTFLYKIVELFEVNFLHETKQNLTIILQKSDRNRWSGRKGLMQTGHFRTRCNKQGQLVYSIVIWDYAPNRDKTLAHELGHFYYACTNPQLNTELEADLFCSRLGININSDEFQPSLSDQSRGWTREQIESNFRQAVESLLSTVDLKPIIKSKIRKFK